MPNIILNISLYFTGITTCIYTELAPKLTEMASVAQSVESRARLKAGSLGVAFLATDPVWVLKWVLGLLTLEFT